MTDWSLKCQYDERLSRYRGRMKAVGRIAGQMIKVIYVFLKRDYDLLASLSERQTHRPQRYMTR